MPNVIAKAGYRATSVQNSWILSADYHWPIQIRTPRTPMILSNHWIPSRQETRLPVHWPTHKATHSVTTPKYVSFTDLSPQTLQKVTRSLIPHHEHCNQWPLSPECVPVTESSKDPAADLPPGMLQSLTPRLRCPNNWYSPTRPFQTLTHSQVTPISDFPQGHPNHDLSFAPNHWPIPQVHPDHWHTH